LKPLFTGRAIKAEGKLKILDLLHKEKPYFSLLLIYLGAAGHSTDTFLQAILRDPNLLQNTYLPFTQDFRVH
jgi:hypothetical protein